MSLENKNQSRWGGLLEELKKEFYSRENELFTLQELDSRIVDKSLNQEHIYTFIVESIAKLCGAEAAQVLIRNQNCLKIVASKPERNIDNVLYIQQCATGLCNNNKRPHIKESSLDHWRLRNDLVLIAYHLKYYIEFVVM